MKSKLYKVFFRIAIVVFGVLLSFVGACTSLSNDVYNRVVDTVFASGIVFDARAMGRNSKQALEEMLALANDINQNASLTMDTPLRRFNESREVGVDFEVNSDIYNMVVSSKEYYKITKGHFNIAVLPLLELWHTDSDSLAEFSPYDMTIKYSTIEGNASIKAQPDSLPTPKEINAIVDSGALNLDNLVVTKDETSGKFYLSKRVATLEIDLGGVAKGYLAQMSKEIADSYGLKSALINISGDIYAYKHEYNSSGKPVPWRVGITDPRPRFYPLPRGVIAATEVVSSGIVTSGDYERYYYYAYDDDTTFDDLVAVAHIMNPITHAPIGLAYNEATGRWYNDKMSIASATVVGESALDTEIMATAVSTMSLKDAIALLESLGMEGLLFADDNRAAVSEGFTFYNTDTYNKYQKYKEINNRW